jgi:hypothetical protein
MVDTRDFINGERFQSIADMFLGSVEDITSNPVIFEQIEKHQILENIDCMFDNPHILFLYPHHLRLFASRLKYFANPFVLITHNSDVNLAETNKYVREILASPLLLSWWGQNLCFTHPKMHFLPIGLANTMWEHGDLSIFENLSFEKTNRIFVNFQIYTNVEKRRPCVDALGEMLPMVTARENIKRLSTYKWCACPEGNGVDTHRIWEALYTRTIPIVVKSPFIEALMHYTNNELPICVIDSWWDFELPVYDESAFRHVNKWLSLKHWRALIEIRKPTVSL